MIEYFKNLDIEAYVLFVISILFAYYFYRKGKVKKQIKYNHRRTYSLILFDDNDKPDNLKILWNNKQLSNVFKTEIYFKNTGTTALKSDDFHRPITITLGEQVGVLQTKVFSSSEYTNLDWNSRNEKLSINVGTIERKEYLKVEILYSNPSVSPLNIELAIINGKSGKLTLKDTNSTHISNRSSYIPFQQALESIYKLMISALAMCGVLAMLILRFGTDIRMSILFSIMIVAFVASLNILRIAIKDEGFRKIKWVEQISITDVEKLRNEALNYFNKYPPNG